MIDLDLSLPVSQVRVLIGDINIEHISDTNIDYVLNKNNGDILLAASECLDYIINSVAFYAREEVGDVKVYWNQVYDQLVKRKSDLDKDNTYKKAKTLFYFGGTSKTDVNSVKSNTEYVSPSEKDFLNIIDSFDIDIEDPYLLRRI